MIEGKEVYGWNDDGVEFMADKIKPYAKFRYDEKNDDVIEVEG